MTRTTSPPTVTRLPTYRRSARASLVSNVSATTLTSTPRTSAASRGLRGPSGGDIDMDQRVETPGPNAPVTRAPWVVNWSAVWVGALAAVAALVVFGLIGAAIGLHLTGQDARITEWKNAKFGAVIFS